ncbi:MAG TPA: hypothetical protein VGU23_05590 [Acidobacteriaceae bacterium]|nr:hypothetical protein [Acidobacteriaceae bacterium]
MTMKLDLNSPPALTAEEKVQLQKLADMKDEDIDYSDIPRTPADAKWTRPGRLVGASSPEVVALDADLLQHFERGGRADSVKVNAALREYIATRSKAS